MPWTHFHVLGDSDALDTDGDGFSDALENEYGTDPFDADSHPDILMDSDPYSHPVDTDGDGFPDGMEEHFSTDPNDFLSHPEAVMANHARITPDLPVNRADTLDVPFSVAEA